MEGIESSEDGIILQVLADDFPLEDRQTLEKQLEEWDILIPGFFPPNPGLLSLEAQCISENDGVYIVVLADRNLVTRWASIAKDGVKAPMDLPTQQATYLMAFAQTANWDVEPSVSFHELASHIGDEDAHKQLSWFRAADSAQRSSWINIALGRAGNLPDAVPVTEVPSNLAFPLNSWRMNYVIALKIAELELGSMTPRQRMQELLRWMEDDFIFAGPAYFYAAKYFSPHACKRGMMKNLRANIRKKALAGVKNEAWDITYLSEFYRIIRECVDHKKQYIFATADKKLASLAKLMVLQSDDNEGIRILSEWWQNEDAKNIVYNRRRIANVAYQRPKHTSLELISKLDKFTLSGEEFLKQWSKNNNS